MKLWVGVTDKAWFDDLARQQPDEVNFWQPSGSRNFRAIEPGEPFLFKLHSPDNYIVGGGFFVRYSPLPASLAWDAFERKNGVASLPALLARVRRYRRANDAIDPVIGCNVLVEPFFLQRDDWIPVPGDWATNIVQGKTETYTSCCAGYSAWVSFRTREETIAPCKARNNKRARTSTACFEVRAGRCTTIDPRTCTPRVASRSASSGLRRDPALPTTCATSTARPAA